MTLPVARIGDTHVCPRHGINAVIEGGSCTVDGRPVAREGDKCACGGVIVEGRDGATDQGRRIAYLGARTSCGGIITACSASAGFS